MALKKESKKSTDKTSKSPKLSVDKQQNSKGQDLGFKDDKVFYSDDEYEQIRAHTGMYISYRGMRAKRHLFKEIFNNALDECISPESPANKVEVFFNEETQEIIVSDNGRGLPLNEMFNFITKKHYSTKDRNETKVDTAGENGVGLKITAALSDKFIATSFRGYESRTVRVIDGKPILDPIKSEKKYRTGFMVDFIPSEKYLCETKDTAFSLKVEDLDEWLRQMSYIIPEGITMKLIGEKRGSDLAIMRTYVRQGIAADVNFMTSDAEFSPVSLVAKSDEDATEFKLECAFTYDKNVDNEYVDSYCNYIHTIENGTHVEACIGAICSFLTKEARIMDPESKYPILYEDCKKGLVIAVNCEARAPMLAGQTKEKVTSETILSSGRKSITSAINAYFEDNRSLLRSIVKYLRDIAKIRMEANKIKGIDTKKPSNWVEDAAVREYYPLANRNSKGYKELFITEGDSAASVVNSVRDRNHQAIFRLLGVVENTLEQPLHKIMGVNGNETLKHLVKILGCGIGSDFNIANLKWNKLIILSDSDVDGAYITSLLCAFFAKHMPDIILEERLYKAVPPLYHLSDRKKSYYKNYEVLYDKHEYFKLFNRIVADNVEIMFVYIDGQTKELSKKDKLNWLEKNINYLYYLNNLSRKVAAPSHIVEKVCWNLILAGGSAEKFKKLIEKEFPEMIYSNSEQSLVGSYKGEFVSMIVDSLFVKIAEMFIKLLASEETFMVAMKPINDKTIDWEIMTIGSFLNVLDSKFGIDIDQRFKGVGEVEEDLLFRTVINPKLRKLYKMTIADVDSALKVIEVLHGRQFAEERKNMIKDKEFTLEDIDN